MMNKKNIESIVEQIKGTLSLEELDELERQYNEMYDKLKLQKDIQAAYSKSMENQNPIDY